MASSISNSDLTFTTTLSGASYGQDSYSSFEGVGMNGVSCLFAVRGAQIYKLTVSAHYVGSQSISNSNLASTSKIISGKTSRLLNCYPKLSLYCSALASVIGIVALALLGLGGTSKDVLEGTAYLGVIFTPCLLVSLIICCSGIRSHSKGKTRLEALEREAIAELLPKAKEEAAKYLIEEKV